jgi:hypothetical protein
MPKFAVGDSVAKDKEHSGKVAADLPLPISSS